MLLSFDLHVLFYITKYHGLFELQLQNLYYSEMYLMNVGYFWGMNIISVIDIILFFCNRNPCYQHEISETDFKVAFPSNAINIFQCCPATYFKVRKISFKLVVLLGPVILGELVNKFLGVEDIHLWVFPFPSLCICLHDKDLVTKTVLFCFFKPIFGI